MGAIKEFMQFLKEYNVVALAIGFMMGLEVKNLTGAFVDDLVMPFVNPLLADGTWQAATLSLGPVMLKWGHFLSALLSFAIIALVVFALAKVVLKEEDVSKK